METEYRNNDCEGAVSAEEAVKKAYLEDLKITRQLAKEDPQTYNPDVAATLNNLGHLYANELNPDYEKAEAAFDESLGIYRSLAFDHPQAWNPYVANTLANMANFYRYGRPNKALSIQYAEEALKILKGCSDSAMVKAARNLANWTLNYWKTH